MCHGEIPVLGGHGGIEGSNKARDEARRATRTRDLRGACCHGALLKKRDEVVNDLSTSSNFVDIEISFRYVGGTAGAGWDDKVQVFKRIERVLTCAHNDGNVGTIISLVDILMIAFGLREMEGAYNSPIHARRKRSRNRDDWRARWEERAHLAHGTIVFSKVCAPVHDAVRLINEHRYHVSQEGGVAKDAVGEGARL